MMVEIYYRHHLYDLEILVESKDAGELKALKYSKMKHDDISKFKGAKKIFVVLEPGDYTFKVISKHPGNMEHSSQYAVKYYEFQLYIVLAEDMPSGKTIQPNLNMFGQLGPFGYGFG